jgi:hypothetical protein
LENRRSCHQGFDDVAMMKLQQGEHALIVSFFPSEIEKLRDFMFAHQLKFMLLVESVAIENPSEPMICLANASLLAHADVSKFLLTNQAKFGSEVYFPGHYPLPGPENVVLESLLSLGFGSFVFCLSFDDPLLKIFGSEKIIPLLEKLGLEEEESLEHNMITQSIGRAREKVEKKVNREILSKSPSEWFALNVKAPL